MKAKFVLLFLFYICSVSKMSSQISINFNGSTEFCIGEQKIFSITANSSSVCAIELTNASTSLLGPNFNNCSNGGFCPFPSGSTSPNLTVSLNSAVTTVLSAQPFDCNGTALSAPITIVFTPRPPLTGLWLTGEYAGIGIRHVIAAKPGFSTYAWTIDGSPVPNQSASFIGISKFRSTPIRTFCVTATDCNNNVVSDVCIDY